MVKFENKMHIIRNFYSMAFTNLRSYSWLYLLMFLLPLKVSNGHLPMCKNACNTSKCVKFAQNTLSKMNTDVNPCDDFYKFACGKFPENTIFSESEQKNHIALMSNYPGMYDFLAKMIENTTNSDHNSIEFKRKVIYNSCLTFQNVEKEILVMKQKIADYFIPNWPYISNNNTGQADVNLWLANLLLSEEFAFFSFHIWTSYSSSYENYFKSRGLDLPANSTADNVEIKMNIDSSVMFEGCTVESENKSNTFLHRVVDALNFPNAISDRMIQDAYEVNSLMQDIFNDKYQREDYNDTQEYNCTSNALINRWCYIMKIVTDRTEISDDLVNASIKFYQQEKFLIISELLNSFSSQKIANYLAIRVIIRNLRELNELTPYIHFPCKRTRHLNADINFKNRRLKCAHFVASNLPLLLTTEFIQSQMITKRLGSVANILNEILHSLKNILNITWVNEEGEKELQDMFVRTTLNQLDYIHFINSSSSIRLRYLGLNVSSNSIFLNMNSMSITRVTDLQKNCREGFLYSIFSFLNPFYINAASGIDIDIGYGFFEIPFSDDDVLPRITEFAKFGFVLAHEIIHNLHFAVAPNMKNNQTFLTYEKCVSDLYSNFTIPTMGIINQINKTFPENFADVLGLQITYDAFKNYSAISDETVFPGLSHFTSDQLFFIFTAQQWCEFGNHYKGYLENVHSPSHHRVIGPTMNLDSFSEAFNCRKESYMNPPEKCVF